LFFLEVGEDASDTCSLDFDEDLQTVRLYRNRLLDFHRTLPSVTVRNVSIVDIFVSSFGASSRKPMTT